MPDAAGCLVEDVAAPPKSFTIDCMATLRTKLASAIVALCTATVLGACGNESGTAETASEPTSESSPSPAEETSTDSGGLPECAEVWVDGQDLPKDYTACSADGETVKLADEVLKQVQLG